LENTFVMITEIAPVGNTYYPWKHKLKGTSVGHKNLSVKTQSFLSQVHRYVYKTAAGKIIYNQNILWKIMGSYSNNLKEKQFYYSDIQNLPPSPLVWL